LDNWIINIHGQIDLKDKFIGAFQLKLIEKEKQIENMVDVICDTNDLMQMVGVTCDTNDVMVDTNTFNDIIDDSLASHENESFINNALMKTIEE
jgi:hypothetical protein